MQQLLETKFGFSSENIKVLREQEATRKAILDTFCAHLVGRARSGDAVFFYFSGHGSQTGDQAPIDEPDGFDETIVPYDSRVGGGVDIRDDEIHSLVQRLATTNVVLVLDSCHSGTAARAVATPRRIDPDPRFPPPPADARPNSKAVSNGFRPAGSYVLISGSRSDQLSFERTFPEGVHGVLTYYLSGRMRESGPNATYRDVFERTAADITGRSLGQAPQLEGGSADNYLFLEQNAFASPYALVNPAPPNAVELKAGAVHGVTVGSKYDVFDPATLEFKSATRIAEIEITTVSPFFARAKVLSGQVTERASRAVETAHSYPESKLRVHPADVGPTFLEAIKVALGSNHNIEFVDAMKADLSLIDVVDRTEASRRSSPAEYAFHFPEGFQLSPSIRANETGAPAKLASQLRQWSKWFEVLRLQNPSPRLSAEVSIQKKAGQARPATSGELAGRLLLNHGEEFTLKIRNTSSTDIWIAVLDLASDGSIAAVYPPAGEGQKLLVGAAWEDSYKAEVLNGSEVRDVLKVIISTEPVEARILFQPEIRLVPGPLDRILAAASAGSRQISAQPILDWTTIDQSIVVRK